MNVIIFDIDGTLADTKPGIISALNCVLKKYDKSIIVDSECSKFIGPPIKDSLIRFRGFEKKEAEEATELYRKIYVDNYITGSYIYPGIKEVIDTLMKDGNVVGIATMKTKPQVDKFVELFFADTSFNVIKVAREDGNLSKTQMLAEIKKIYVDADRYIMIGDTMGDYTAAKINEYEFIGVEYGYGDFEQASVNKVLSAEQLLSALNSLF